MIENNSLYYMVISALGFLEDLTFKAQPTDVD
jgi:hypothetical protein